MYRDNAPVDLLLHTAVNKAETPSGCRLMCMVSMSDSYVLSSCCCTPVLSLVLYGFLVGTGSLEVYSHKIICYSGLWLAGEPVPSLTKTQEAII